MEEKHNISRLGVQIGGISEETAKSSFSAKLTINKEKSDTQLQRIGSYLTGLGSEISMVSCLLQKMANSNLYRSSLKHS